MDRTPELVGYLDAAPGPLRSLLPESLLEELEPTADYDGNVVIRTAPSGAEKHVELADVREHVDDGDYFQMRACRISGTEHLNVTFGITKSLDSYGDRPPVVLLYFHAPALHSQTAGAMTDRLVEFALSLYEQLPMRFVHVITTGPIEPDRMPERDELARRVMTGGAFLDVLGPSVVDALDRGTLLSAPAYEIRELYDGGVLIRAFELMDDVNQEDLQAIRDHVHSA